MTEERQIELYNKILGWVSQTFKYYSLYEWARQRGMTDEEIINEFCFEEDEIEEYREEYKNSFRK